MAKTGLGWVVWRRGKKDSDKSMSFGRWASFRDRTDNGDGTVTLRFEGEGGNGDKTQLSITLRKGDLERLGGPSDGQ